MIKGINKQMIVLKLENNRLYESACFMLRSDVKQRREEEKDMLSEANRILSEMEIKRPRSTKRGGFRRFLWSAMLMVIGVAIGFGVAFVAFGK